MSLPLQFGIPVARSSSQHLPLAYLPPALVVIIGGGWHLLGLRSTKAMVRLFRPSPRAQTLALHLLLTERGLPLGQVAGTGTASPGLDSLRASEEALKQAHGRSRPSNVDMSRVSVLLRQVLDEVRLLLCFVCAHPSFFVTRNAGQANSRAPHA